MKRSASEPSLRTLQQQFLAAVMNPLTADLESACRKDGKDIVSRTAKKIIADPGGLPALLRLAIYNRQYWYRLIDCMYEDFPGVLLLLGKERFNFIVQKYLTAFPSASFTLRNLGSRFEKFFLKNRSLFGARAAICHDMIRFEWAQVLAFDSEQRRLVTAADLSSKRRIYLQPYVILLELNYPCDELVRDLRSSVHGGSEAAVGEHEQSLTQVLRKLPPRERIYLAVHRHDSMLFSKRLSEAEFHALSAFRRGSTVPAALTRGTAKLPAHVKRSPETTSVEVARWFKEWGALGWLCLKN